MVNVTRKITLIKIAVLKRLQYVNTKHIQILFIFLTKNRNFGKCCTYTYKRFNKIQLQFVLSGFIYGITETVIESCLK